MPAARRPRPSIFFAAAILAALAAGLVERGWSRLRAGAAAPVPEARWIWAEGTTDRRRPAVFCAVGDFDVAERPATAWLEIVADESYYAYLNGAYVGAGAYRPGQALDRYPVAGLLERGRNRLVLELRSTRGAGGLLAAIVAEGPDGRRALVASHEGWRIHRRSHPRLFAADSLAGGEEPRVWGRPPTGRWRPRPAETALPVPFTDGAPAERLSPRRARRPEPGNRWIAIGRPKPRFPLQGGQVLLDWGREVEGFLYFDLARPDPPPGLLYLGDEPPDPLRDEPTAVLLFLPGQQGWRDLYPRRFRYALLVGVEPRTRVEVRLVEPDLAAALRPPPPPEGGVFGLRLEDRLPAVEARVWRRLERRR